jgi:hypothetical protein
MFSSVQSYFRAFNEPFEGAIPFMYLDVKGLVTVGVGNLIDPVELATALPFRFKNQPEQHAAPAQIEAEWHKLKSDTSLASKGHLACAALTELELGNDAIENLINHRLTSNETLLKSQESFHAFESWPADAQLALLSMAWAMGPDGFRTFPNFRAACQNMDFETAAKESRLDENGNPGLIPRNEANFTLLSNASIVLTENLRRSNLYYPGSPTS